MAVPVLPGKSDELRKMFNSFRNEKRNEYLESQKKARVVKERDFLQVTPMGNMLIFYIESNDLKKTFTDFGMSKDPFDVWLKGQLKDFTGVDFSQPPSGPQPEMREMMPDLLMSYDS